jgi:hypothetical protein
LKSPTLEYFSSEASSINLDPVILFVSQFMRMRSFWNLRRFPELPFEDPVADLFRYCEPGSPHIEQLRFIENNVTRVPGNVTGNRKRPKRRAIQYFQPEVFLYTFDVDSKVAQSAAGMPFQNYLGNFSELGFRVATVLVVHTMGVNTARQNYFFIKSCWLSVIVTSQPEWL